MAKSITDTLAAEKDGITVSDSSRNAGLSRIVGQKIRQARNAAGLTQEELCDGHLTRNMLSQIERGASLPSLPTLIFLASQLHLDPGYFLSKEESALQTRLRILLPEIRQTFSQKQYRLCIDLCDPFTETGDDEICYLLSRCYFALGAEQFRKGKGQHATELFRTAIRFGSRSCYEHGDCEMAQFYIDFWQSQSGGTRLPNPAEAVPSQKEFSDLTTYIYILNLISDGMAERAAAIYDTTRIESLFLRRHINARLSIAGANYGRAKELLREILETHSEFDSFPMNETILRDLELCCKATGDFEGAYDCAAKRLALLREQQN